MAFRNIESFLNRLNSPRAIQDRALHLNAISYHCVRESQEDPLPSEFYENSFSKLRKLTHLLKDLDFVDGRLIRISDNSKVVDDFLLHSMHSFKSLGMAFLGSPMMHEMLNKDMTDLLKDIKYSPPLCFNTKSERKPISINSLSKVYSILNMSAQQKKFVRLAICPQVTQYQIWTGALEDILNGLKSDLDSLNNRRMTTKGAKLGQQIVVSCLKFLENTVSYDPDSTSWMRLLPTKVAEPLSPCKWKDFLDMFDDLINCLKNENEFILHVTKLEIMREGLQQIKDVVQDKSLGYRETRRQQSLVQKKLTKALGHSSQCLFTLLVYYLYGSVRNIEVDLRSWFTDADKFCLCVGKILTSDEEKMIWNGVKQLDKALGLVKFIRETAEMKGVLELRGHLWCVGAENRSLTYKGNVYFVHKIRF